MKAFFNLWLERLSRWFRNVLSDDGNQSSTRLVFLGAWASVLFVWVVLCLWNRHIDGIDGSVLTLLSIVTGGKAWDKHVENR